MIGWLRRRRRSPFRDVKRILISLVVVGATGSLATAGTWATLSSKTTNPGSTIASGTMTLSVNTTPTGGTASSCLSASGSSASNDVNSNCGSFLAGLGPFFPGQSATAKVTIQNTGSYPPGYAGGTLSTAASGTVTSLSLSSLTSPVSSGDKLIVFNATNTTTCVTSASHASSATTVSLSVDSCTMPVTYAIGSKVTDESEGTFEAYMSSCTLQSEAGAPSGTGFATGNPCSQIEFTLQETTSNGTNLTCWYGGSGCAFSATDTLTNFLNNYPDSAPGDPLVFTGGLGAGATRYFTLGFQLPTFSSTTTGNLYEGVQGVISFTWHIEP